MSKNYSSWDAFFYPGQNTEIWEEKLQEMVPSCAGISFATRQMLIDWHLGRKLWLLKT